MSEKFNPKSCDKKSQQEEKIQRRMAAIRAETEEYRRMGQRLDRLSVMDGVGSFMAECDEEVAKGLRDFNVKISDFDKE